MVAYKKLTREERQTIGRKMTSNYYENSEAFKLLQEIQKEYVYELTKYIPAEVEELNKKYPSTIRKTSYNIWVKNFIDRDSCYYADSSYFLWPYLKGEDIIVGFSLKFSDCWYTDSNEIKEYIKKENPDLYDKIMNQLIPKLNLIDKFADNLECVLRNITTVNRLKEELPEAYEIYVGKFGEPTDKKCKSTNKSNVCDKVEKLRAEYNSNK